MTAPIEELERIDLAHYAPPCEATHDRDDIPAAVWIWRVPCPRHHNVILLLCQEHDDHYLAAWANPRTSVTHGRCPVDLSMFGQPNREQL